LLSICGADFPSDKGWGGPFFWTLSDKLPAMNHVALRSYDGSAFVARVGKTKGRVWGNSSIPCTHLNESGAEGKAVFFIGTAAELEQAIGQ
jgi:hypothetical protein